MEHSCPTDQMCFASVFIPLLIWWLASSVLVWLTWNKVIGVFTKVRGMKLWQAMLVLLTLITLVAPKYCMKHCSMGKGHCSQRHDGHSAEACCKKQDCCSSSEGNECSHSKDCCAKDKDCCSEKEGCNHMKKEGKSKEGSKECEECSRHSKDSKDPKDKPKPAK